jgi:hypothetical protein
MIKLNTWAGRRSFSYEGSVETGTKIVFGKGFSAKITASAYKSLLQHFHGQVVNIGTSRTSPPVGSVGEWMMKNVIKQALTSYIGPILIYEGYAEKIGGPDIKFH